jgi:hypothetical protein
VAQGHEDAVIRIGWEMTLKSWPWGIKDYEVYTKFWRKIVTAMRSVPGEKFKFDWNVNNGFNDYRDATKYYPGDKYVDYVGVDAYDLNATVYPYPKKCNTECRTTRQQEAWDENIFGNEWGLDFWSGFANSHKKPLSLPEWGLWTLFNGSDGGDDNPYYIKQMYEFINDPNNNVAYAAYFNYDDADGNHTLDKAFPKGGKMYKKLFAVKKSKN